MELKEDTGEDKLDWNHKVNQLVNLRISESQKKASETFQSKKELEGDLEKETEKLISRKLRVLEEDTWPCPYCEKVIC